MPAGAGNEPSYFASGRVSPAAVEKLFTTCAHLFAVQPWAVADDTQAIRMDIPALDVDGACVSVIGGLDECPGLSIFPSVEGLERFLEAAAGLLEEGALPGTELLSLIFEPVAELPPSMRREASVWEVEAVDPGQLT